MALTFKETAKGEKSFKGKNILLIQIIEIKKKIKLPT